VLYLSGNNGANRSNNHPLRMRQYLAQSLPTQLAQVLPERKEAYKMSLVSKTHGDKPATFPYLESRQFNFSWTRIRSRPPSPSSVTWSPRAYQGSTLGSDGYVPFLVSLSSVCGQARRSIPVFGVKCCWIPIFIINHMICAST